MVQNRQKVKTNPFTFRRHLAILGTFFKVHFPWESFFKVHFPYVQSSWNQAKNAFVSYKNLDYAVLKINKFLPKRAPLNVSTSIPNNDNKIFAIGHVGCTPLKVMEGVIRLKQPKESWKNWLKSNAMHYCPTPSCEGGNTEVICPHNLPSEKCLKKLFWAFKKSSKS